MPTTGSRKSPPRPLLKPPVASMRKDTEMTYTAARTNQVCAGFPGRRIPRKADTKRNAVLIRNAPTLVGPGGHSALSCPTTATAAKGM